MGLHQILRLLSVIRGERREQRMVRMAVAEGAFSTPVCGDDQRGPGDEGLNEAGDRCLIRDPRQFEVEVAGETQRPPDFVRVKRRVFGLQMGLEANDVLGSGPFRRRARRAGFEKSPRLENLSGFADRWSGDECSPVPFDGHEPVMGELLKGRAHQRSGHAIDGPDFVLAELRARSDPLFVDRGGEPSCNRRAAALARGLPQGSRLGARQDYLPYQ